MTGEEHGIRLGRRAFLQQGTLMLLAANARVPRLRASDDAPRIRVGLVTDLHYADKASNGTRHYRETLSKLEEAAARFDKHKPDFVVELGDFIDAGNSVDIEKRYLHTVNQTFSAISKDRHYVLGNHCVDTLTKEEFLGVVEQDQSYYSFERSGFHFVVLDSCFRSDGQPYGRKNFEWTDANIPAAELEWLEGDLKASNQPVVVFAHQRLDVNNSYGIQNQAAVRKVFETSGKLLAVFQGHSHENDLKEIGDIPYCTLAAMVEGAGPENNSYSVMEIEPSGTIRLSGFRKQQSHRFEKRD